MSDVIALHLPTGFIGGLCSCGWVTASQYGLSTEELNREWAKHFVREFKVDSVPLAEFIVDVLAQHSTGPSRSTCACGWAADRHPGKREDEFNRDWAVHLEQAVDRHMAVSLSIAVLLMVVVLAVAVAVASMTDGVVRLGAGVIAAVMLWLAITRSLALIQLQRVRRRI